ncbi:hypothetical protein D3C87_1469500 [compost metagenome]
MFDGIEQFDVQVEHFLASGSDVQAVAQLRANHAGEIAIQLAERRIVRGVYQTTVEHQIAGDVSVEVAVIVTAADTQCFAQRHQILIGAA